MQLIPNGSFQLQRGSTHIGYSILGEGAPVVVCPVPWGVSSHVWNALIELSKEFTLIFIDPRGVGLSGKVSECSEYGIPTLVNDIEAVRQHLGIQQWHVYGSSAAGFTALEYALAFPAVTKKIIVVCSSPTGFFHKGTIHDKTHPRYEDIRYAVEALRKEFTAEKFRQYMLVVYVLDVQNEKGKEEILSVFGTTDISMERYKYFAAVELNRYNVTERLASIVQPTLVIAGAHDVHVSPSHSETIMQNISHAQFVLMETCGHFPWLDEREKFLSTVKKFLQE